MKNIKENKFYSREEAADYIPEVMNEMKVLLCGVGALGQNIALNLALSQVGLISLMDRDDFKDHNATRSPFFPTEEDIEKWGLGKAKVVAHKIREMTSFSNSSFISLLFFLSPNFSSSHSILILLSSPTLPSNCS